MKKCFFTLFLTLIVTLSVAQESQTTYNFLRVPVSAHAAALGGDNITLIDDDATLLFHNPALLTSASDKTITLNYLNYMAGVNMMSASFSRVVRERASWAVSAQYINYGDMTQMDADNVQTGTFAAKDIAFAGTFSYLLTDRLAGGITARLITSYLGDYNSIGAGFDLGLNYYDPDREWSLSVVAKNLGGQLKAYNEVYDHMPIDLQIGGSKRVKHTPFRLSATAVDLNHWNYKFIYHWVFGVDILLSDNAWVGAGYNLRRANEMKIVHDDDESSHGAGLSLGAGLTLDHFKLGVAYGKYHVSSSSLIVNAAYTL